MGPARPSEGVATPFGEAFPDGSLPCWNLAVWAHVGSDLLASSARVRSRSGRASSQSRTVSFSSPLRRGGGGGGMGVRRRRAPSPGARAQQRVTHLQARSPLALATVQSRPVALRPILPTTVSRTYCLCRGRKGDPQGSGQPTTCSRGTRSGVPLLFLRGELLSQGSGGGRTADSKREKTSHKPRTGDGGLPQNSWPGRTPKPTAWKQKGQGASQTEEPEETR